MYTIAKERVNEYYKWPCPHCKSSLYPDVTPLRENVMKCLACGRDYIFVKFANNGEEMVLTTPSSVANEQETDDDLVDKRRIKPRKMTEKPFVKNALSRKKTWNRDGSLW